MDCLQDDSSQQERAQLSEDTERLKALLEAEAAAGGSKIENEISSENFRAPSPVPGTSRQYEEEEEDEDDKGNVSLNLSQVSLRGSDEFGVLPVNADACLMLNLAYQEIISELLDQVKTAMDYNKEKQTQCELMMEETAQARQSRKLKNSYVPYAYPFFSDKDGMTPPLNTDTLTKQQLGERNGFLKPRKMWSKENKDDIRNAVKSQVLQKLMRPFVNRKEILVEKLESHLPGSEAEEEIKLEIKQIDEKLMEIGFMNDEDVFEKSVLMSDEIDWMMISSTAMEGTVTVPQIKYAWLNLLNPNIRKTKWMRSEDDTLLELVEIHEERNWKTIAEELGTGRTPVQCLQRYMTELNPALKSGKWSKEESTLLLEVVDNCVFEGHINWTEVAENVEGRTADQCEDHYQYLTECRDAHYQRWSLDEDEKLAGLVEKYGRDRWQRISEHMPGRGTQACRERYLNHLDINISFKDFMYSEDRLIWKYCLECDQTGEKPRWTRLAKILPGRTSRRLLWRFVNLRKWKSHWDFFDSLPESIRDFIKTMQKKFVPKHKYKNRKKKKEVVKVQKDVPWDLTDEEKLLYETDVNEGFFVPRPFCFVTFTGRDVAGQIARMVAKHQNLVETTRRLLIKRKIQMGPEEIMESIGEILKAENDHFNSDKRVLFFQIKKMTRFGNKTVLKECAEGVARFIGGLKRLRRKKQATRQYDKQIEYLMARKFLKQKKPYSSEAAETTSESLTNEQKTNYESLILGLFTKALSVDIPKATFVADRQLNNNPLLKKAGKVATKYAAESIQKILKVDDLQSAMDKFPMMKERLKKHLEEQAAIEQQEDGNSDNQDADSKDSKDVIPVKKPRYCLSKSQKTDPLAPIVEELPDKSRYRMPPLPPTMSTINAFRTLQTQRSTLIKEAGNMYVPIKEEETEEEAYERIPRAIKISENLHDYRTFENRFNAIFMWPALMSTVMTDERINAQTNGRTDAQAEVEEIPTDEDIDEEKESDDENKDGDSSSDDNDEGDTHNRRFTSVTNEREERRAARQKKRSEEEMKLVEHSKLPDTVKERIRNGGVVLRPQRYCRAKKGPALVATKKMRRFWVMSRQKKIEYLDRANSWRKRKAEKLANVSPGGAVDNPGGASSNPGGTSSHPGGTSSHPDGASSNPGGVRENGVQEGAQKSETMKNLVESSVGTNDTGNSPVKIKKKRQIGVKWPKHVSRRSGRIRKRTYKCNEKEVSDNDIAPKKAKMDNEKDNEKDVSDDDVTPKQVEAERDS